MQQLQFKPFSKEALIAGLQQQFPQYKIQMGMGTLQVRTSGFTITGNVAIKCKPASGKITTSTNLDMVFVYLFLMLPLGIYILAKQGRTKRLESEVVAGLKQLLEPLD